MCVHYSAVVDWYTCEHVFAVDLINCRVIRKVKLKSECSITTLQGRLELLNNVVELSSKETL